MTAAERVLKLERSNEYTETQVVAMALFELADVIEEAVADIKGAIDQLTVVMAKTRGNHQEH